MLLSDLLKQNSENDKVASALSCLTKKKKKNLDMPSLNSKLFPEYFGMVREGMQGYQRITMH